MEEIARVLTRHPPSDPLPAVPPAQMTAQQDLLSVHAETPASRPIVTCARRASHHPLLAGASSRGRPAPSS